jgi:hypothetical protein
MKKGLSNTILSFENECRSSSGSLGCWGYLPDRVARRVFCSVAMENGDDRPLSAIAKAFKELEGELNQGEGAVLKVAPFAHACSLISILFGCLGIAFKFAEKDYVGKVRNTGCY